MTRKRAILIFVACLPLGLPVCALYLASERAIRWWRMRSA
jgi:hypothetical protein